MASRCEVVMIKLAEWSDISTIKVTTDDGEVSFVPDDFGNRHREEIEEWVKAGGVIAPLATGPVAYTISKKTPWIRMTDAEATTVANAMKTQSVRFQMIYDAANELTTTDDLYTTLKQFLGAALS